MPEATCSSSRLYQLERPSSTSGLPVKYGFRVEHVVLQPTTMCNLNCDYCYLPDRAAKRLMTTEIAERVAAFASDSPTAIGLIWHGGEPLASGLNHFRLLLDCFENLREQGKVTHYVQTNATLVSPLWCDLFRSYAVRVGVSIDGPECLNGGRRDWAGKPTFRPTLRGISALRDAGLDFGLLAVITRPSLPYAAEIYQFAIEQKPKYLGFNVEETEGIHQAAVMPFNELVSFWRDIYRAWSANPSIEVREISRVLLHMELTASGLPSFYRDRIIDLMPTVDYAGNMTALSPEFLNGSSAFVLGNVALVPMETLVREGEKSPYVNAFLRGLELCRRDCQYFDFCGGGSASNRFFENGRLDCSETRYCQNRTKTLVDALLSVLGEEQNGFIA